MEHRIDERLAMIEDDLKTPMHERPVSRERAYLDKLFDSSLVYAKYYVLPEYVWTSTDGYRANLQKLEWARRSALAGIALEQYQRRHGRWPESLEALQAEDESVDLIDPITGGPVLYTFIDGQPVIYSVGVDRDDDGGQPPACDERGYRPNAASWGENTAHVDGDWILFPLQSSHYEAGEEATRELEREREEERLHQPLP